MNSFMKEENKLEGATNVRAWKTRPNLVLARNKVLNIVKGKVTEPEDDGPEKYKLKENDIMAMIIIMESIIDHRFPYIFHHNCFKELYDALSGLYTINNIGKYMILRNQNNGVKMTHNYTLA